MLTTRWMVWARYWQRQYVVYCCYTMIGEQYYLAPFFWFPSAVSQVCFSNVLANSTKTIIHMVRRNSNFTKFWIWNSYLGFIQAGRWISFVGMGGAGALFVGTLNCPFYFNIIIILFNPYVHKLDKRVRTHGRLNAQTEYRVRTHWAFPRPKLDKMSFIHLTGVLYRHFFY